MTYMKRFEHLDATKNDYHAVCQGYAVCANWDCTYFNWCTSRKVKCGNMITGGYGSIEKYLSLSPSVLKSNCNKCDCNKDDPLCKAFYDVIAFRITNKKKCFREIQKMKVLDSLS